jgi:hypothetical protein
MNVLIIPEDFRKDQQVLKPILTKMLAAVGKPNANIQVCQDPLLGGVSEALKWERISEVIEMYPMVNVFLLVVDRDAKDGRRAALDKISTMAADLIGEGRAFLAENAWQEIEVWALAGIATLPKGWVWNDVRAEAHPKEKYFTPYATSRGLLDEPGQGRTTLGREAAQNYTRVRSRCKEDVAQLEGRLKDWFDSMG